MILIANVLQPLIDVCDSVLEFWHDQAGLSWGASIIMLTVCVRLAILPLTFKQVRSMQDLQRLQPEMKRIQERYKDDRQRMNQEMMKLYQEHKVNPLGSCLPILLQLPFFIALFYLLQGDEFENEIAGEESFLFIDNLADPATGATLAVLIVLYVTTQLISGLVSTVTADPMQRRIILALPFIFVIFIINFEAGLIVYWITTNVWTIGQQLLVRKLFPKPEPIAAKVDAGSKPARGKPPAKATAAAAVADGKGSKGSKGSGNGAPKKGPPPGPRKKKKRTGRRR
jgi:YidC/Oxa1 family membrane protein insertase